MRFEPNHRSDYGEREVRAVRQVLVEIGQVLGAYRSHFVVVGGAVPWLLLEAAQPAHIGTLDIDLNLDPVALSDGEYATLVQSLESKGYLRNVPGIPAFQLRRSVPMQDGDPVVVLVDLLMPRGVKTAKNRPPLVEGLRIQGADGGAVALRHNLWHSVQGIMPDGRGNSIEIQVASIPAFLVMKGYALIGRDKMKDCYDVYYAVRNFPAGPEELSVQCQKLLEDELIREEALQGYRNIAQKFASRESYGPTTVRHFLEEADDLNGMTAEQIQTDAFFQVNIWLEALGLT